SRLRVTLPLDPPPVRSAPAMTPVMVPPPPGKVCPAAKLICPFCAIFKPVSAGVLVPDPNRRLNVPLGEAVLLPAGSACQRNVWFTGALVVLLNDDATKFSGCEFLPAVAVAAAIAGSVTAPRIVAAPATSSVGAGVAVPMPSLAVAPVPVCVTAELCTFVAVVHSGSAFNVPPVVVTSEVARVAADAAGFAAIPPTEATAVPPTGIASANAEGGNPPRVCASAAF